MGRPIPFARLLGETDIPAYALEGPQWPTTSLTWSFVDPASLTGYSGTIAAAYRQTIIDAFTRWSSVSGLTFTQIADSASADIRIGWAALAPATTYRLGVTAIPGLGGFAPDTRIQLEDPAELPLVQDPAVGWTYQGSASSLFQVALHEIGHALGLAHDADVDSIMYPSVGSSNRDLDETDIAGIDALYGLSPTKPGQFSIASAVAVEGDSGTTPLSFTVTRTGGSAAASVRFATIDGTATAASGDYLPASGALVFAAGVTSRTITVSVPGDTVAEPDERFSVQLSSPTNGATIAAATATGTILNDDLPPGTVAIDDVTLAEGSGLLTSFVFTVTRSGGTAPFSVDFSTLDGTATAATGDYLPTHGTLDFAAGVDSRTISVQVVGDYATEPDETFRVMLANPTNGAAITDDFGLGTIVDDDASLPTTATTLPNTALTTTISTTTTQATTTQTTTTQTTTTGGTTTTAATPGTVPVYRFFDRSFGTHFFTASTAERNTLVSTRADLAYEGVGLQSRDPAAADPLIAPVYRFFDTAHGTHFFTASAAESATILATRADLRPEGIGFYEHVAPAAGDQPVYRFFDTAFGTHFYTADASERATILATRTDLKDEGIGFYAPSGP